MFPCSSVLEVITSKSPFAKRSKKSRSQAWLTSLLVTAVTTSVALLPTAAHSQTRNYSPRFAAQARGRTTIFGNAVTSCADGVAPLGGSTSCADARNATVTPATANNDYFIDYVDIDSDGTTFNSSSSTYTFPTANPGFDIVWAGLYWAGNPTAGSGTGASAAPNATQTNQMLLQVPGSAGYQTITASQVDTSGSAYSAFADVTALVRSGTGTGEYFGANIQTGTGGDRYGGWVLIVMYQDDTEVLRNMTVFDGFLRVFNNTVNTTISGFLTPTAGPFEAAFGAFSSEGDVLFQPDNFLMNGTLVQDATNPSTNFFNSSNSLYGTGITTNTTVTTPGGQTLGPISRNPAFPNLLALDMDIVEALDTSGQPIIPNGATSVDLTFTSNGDAYFPTAFFFAVQVFQPVLDQNFTKTVTDVNGGDLNPGDILEYTITYQNTGNDNATDVILRDVIPTNTTYEPNSLQILVDPDPLITPPLAQTDAAGDDRAEFDSANNRVVFRSGTGADDTNGGIVAFDDPAVPGAVDDTVSIAYRVRVSSGISSFPTTISNQADIDYVGQFSGTSFTGVSDDPTTTAQNDPTDIDVVEALDDFGDAPDSYGDANHTISPTLYLGNTAPPDSEPDTQLGTDAGAGADGDDGDGTDDEDGVTFSPSLGTPDTVHIVQAGVSNDVDVVATGAGVLNAWIDYNQDGDFDDPGEQIFTDENLSAGDNSLSFTPDVRLLHGPTYARFRFGSQTGLGPTGSATDGEVEDYEVNIASPVTDINACAVTGLVDGEFELLDISQSSPAFVNSFGSAPTLSRQYNETDVPGWNFAGTTTPTPLDDIEIWQSQHGGGDTPFDAFEGGQHAEINAEENGALFQDVVTTPGASMGWQFAHRGRKGTDSMEFRLGPPGATVSQGTFTSGNDVNDPNEGWKLYNGTYTVPAGQYVTRVELRAVSTANGDIRTGNFIDTVEFTLPPCIPQYDPNLLLVKRITKINDSTTSVAGDNLAAYKQEEAYVYDDNTIETATPPDTDKWPNTTGKASSTFLIGGTDGGRTRPGDEIEYTIYFLSTGNVDAADVQLCDRVPDFQTYVLDAYNSVTPGPSGGVGANRGMLVEYNGDTFSYTNDADGDIAQFFPPGAALPAACNGTAAQTEDNGAIVINLGNLPNATSAGTPTTSFGAVRFRATVK